MAEADGLHPGGNVLMTLAADKVSLWTDLSRLVCTWELFFDFVEFLGLPRTVGEQAQQFHMSNIPAATTEDQAQKAAFSVLLTYEWQNTSRAIQFFRTCPDPELEEKARIAFHTHHSAIWPFHDETVLSSDSDYDSDR